MGGPTARTVLRSESQQEAAIQLSITKVACPSDITLKPYTLAGPTGRLSPATVPAQRHPPPDARPALVMLWDAGRPWHMRKGTHAALVPSGAQPYLIGGWADATVDPGGWLIGTRPCTQLLVKARNDLKLVGWFSGRSFLLSHGRFRVRLPKGPSRGWGIYTPVA